MSSKRKAPAQPDQDWRTFEKAVTRFVEALEPLAKVRHDARLPDRHTGFLRQRDIWVEARFGGHFAIKFLISCKNTSRKLSQTDVDAFWGELQSSGAHKGVLYSKSGFTKPAIAKGRALGISCCVLYDNRAAELPEVLQFSAYVFSQRQELRAYGVEGVEWRELLGADVVDDDGTRRVVDVLLERYAAAKAAAANPLLIDGKPQPWAADVQTTFGDPPREATVRLECAWLIHRAKIDAWLVNGSYSFTDKDFKGSFSTPWIDTRSEDPGPGWEPVSPDAVTAGTIHLATIRSMPDPRDALLATYALNS